MTKCWEELKKDIERIPEIVEKQLEETPAPEGLGEYGTFFIGSGDSYAIALAGESVAGGRALDPLDVSLMHVEGPGDAIMLSAGGRSRRVVEAARYLARRGFRVIAVTGSTTSPLAREAHLVIPLVYNGLACGVGAARHVAMLAALAAMYSSSPRLPSSLYQEPVPFDSQVVYVGAGVGVAAALYTTLKTCEILSECARWWHLEQFAHAPVYGTTSTIMVLYPDPRLERSRLEEYLSAFREANFEIVEAPIASDPWSTAILQAIVAIVSAANEVLARGIEEPGYRSHPALERLTRLIYLEE